MNQKPLSSNPTQVTQKTLESIEETLQKLFEVSGLEKIKVIEKEDKYDATIHDPVRWDSDEEAPVDTIVRLIRRGFIYNGKVLRRAQVVVHQ